VTSGDVLVKVCAVLRERFPGCEAHGDVEHDAEKAQWDAWVVVTGRSGAQVSRHSASAKVKGHAAGALARALGIEFGEDRR
jgi:hypothetical protein